MSSLIPLSEVSTYYTPKLKQFLVDLGKIAQTMNIVEMVTPVNAGEEKRKWLEKAARGEWTNPSFQYNTELLAGVASYERQLKELGGAMMTAFGTVSNENAGKALCQLAEDRYKEVCSTIYLAKAMLDDFDPNTAAAAALETIFGNPGKETVEAAQHYARCLADGEGKDQQDNANLKIIRRRLKSMELDAEQIRKHFVWMAEQCGFAGTRPVEISDTTTSIDVRDKSSRGAVVSIPIDRKVSGLKLVELVGHEILCHWGDSERAARVLPLLGSGALKPADEVLYEGHATLTDYNTHLFLGDKASQQQLPFYVMAMDWAWHGHDFAETADYMYDYVRPTKQRDEEALKQTWTTCFRVFRGSRGIRSSKHPNYAFTKDRAYFEGRLIAEKLHKQKLDSVLEISTLNKSDIDVLMTAVEFEQKDTNQAWNMVNLWSLVYHLLDDKI